MTMHAQELVGARVSSADGEQLGTVEQVFHDDADGRPAWIRIRAGAAERFVPLRGCRMDGSGVLSLPYDARKVMTGPQIDADQHLSGAQAEELSRYYGLAGADTTTTSRGTGREPGSDTMPEADERTTSVADQAEEWLLRQEERFDVGTEVLESGRVKLHKYVDVEPVERTVHVFHEEYEIERVPITEAERSSGIIAESEREIILHEERAVLRKEVVPVERIRLVTKKVPEDQVLRGEVRKERIEVEGGGTQSDPRAMPGS